MRDTALSIPNKMGILWLFTILLESWKKVKGLSGGEWKKEYEEVSRQPGHLFVLLLPSRRKSESCNKTRFLSSLCP
jgi:hypothetical protein